MLFQSPSWFQPINSRYRRKELAFQFGVFDWLEERITPAFGDTGLLSPLAAPGCDPIAAIVAAPRLASFDSTQSALLNSLLTNLTGSGTSLNLTAADYNGLAIADLNLDSLLGELQVLTGAATPQEALTADVTLNQLLLAGASAAQAGGDVAQATVLNNAAGILASLTGTIQLGDLFQVDLPPEYFVQAELNALDLLTGSVQLFNFENVLTTPTPIALSGASIGLASLLNEVSLSAQVVEPPVFVVGETGTSFYSASIRTKLDLDLVGLSLDTSSLLGPIETLLGPLADTVSATATVSQLELYADVARASGSIQSINAITNAVTLQATPAIADLYLGQIADAVFFNRTRALNPATDLTPGIVGDLSISASLLTVPVLNVSAGITLQAFAEGAAPGSQLVNFNAPYPQTQTIGSSAAAIGTLVTDLLTNLEVGMSGSLGALLDPLVGTLTSLLGDVADDVLDPVLTSLLTNLADPLLDTLGVGIGEATLTVLGADSPDPATAVNDTIMTLQNAPVIAPVLANDILPTNCPLTLAVVGAPTSGNAVVNVNNTITYTPNAGFVGTDSFSYSLTDQFGRVTMATVTVEVEEAPVVNQPPVINPDAANTTAGVAVTVDVLANDFDPDGDPISIIGVSPPTNGTVVINANGTITYTPNAGFQGTDAFTYTASDGQGGTGTATVTVSVQPGIAQNNPPTINPDQVTVVQNTPTTIDVLANDTDPDGDTLAVVSVTQPTSGTVVVNANGTITYTPNPGFIGQDSFTYTASDGQGGTGTATVTMTVVAGDSTNTQPQIVADTATTNINQAVTIPVLANDTDPDGDSLSVAAVTQPLNGTVVINANGTVTYTPNTGFVGVDTFSYTASDGRGGVGTATVTVSVSDPATNRVPQINDDAADTPLNLTVFIPVLANDFDPDGDPLTIASVTQPQNGIVTVGPDGVLTYIPNQDFRGYDSFSYTATDGRGGSGTGTVTVAVGLGTGVGDGGDGPGGNRSPFINGDIAITETNQSVVIRVLDNDSDPDGDTLTIVGVTQPANGTVVVNADGTITYTPPDGFTGTVYFGYSASDGRGGTGAALVQVSVGSGGPGPFLPQLKQFAVAADTMGGPRVTVYNPDGSIRHNFFAFDPNSRFGVNVVMGDVTGDGVADIVVAPGFGGGPHIRVLNGLTLEPISDFFAFESSFRGGVTVALGDVNGDGILDLIVSAGLGGGPRVRVIDGAKLGMFLPNGEISQEAVLADFFAYDSSFRGGVSVAVSDINGDGIGELVTGSGVGGPPIIRFWDILSMTMISEFMPFPASFSEGVYVGAYGEYLVVGAGAGGPPIIRTFQGTNFTQIAEIQAYESTFLGGLRVVFGDTVDPTVPLIITGAGPGGGPRIKVLNVDLSVVLPDFMAFEDSFRGGVYVA